MSGRHGKRPKKPDRQSELPPHRAAEQELNNPICGECNSFPTNHFCCFVLPSEDQCGAPVFGICKGHDSEVTHCSRHLWSNTFSNTQETAQSQETAESQETAQSQETAYKNVLYCSSHGIRACGVSRPPRKEEGNDHLSLHKVTGEPVTDLSWILGDEGKLTCMEKFHMLYLPKN